MPREFSDAELHGFLDEALPVALMVEIEQALRTDPAVRERIAAVLQRRDAGMHSLGDVWRRRRLTCLSRDELGSYLLGALSTEREEYARFHLDVVGCRWCGANLEDLRRPQEQVVESTARRRKKYFDSSVGLLGQSRRICK